MQISHSDKILVYRIKNVVRRSMGVVQIYIISAKYINEIIYFLIV